jgi:hypothetical protein
LGRACSGEGLADLAPPPPLLVVFEPLHQGAVAYHRIKNHSPGAQQDQFFRLKMAYLDLQFVVYRSSEVFFTTLFTTSRSLPDAWDKISPIYR